MTTDVILDYTDEAPLGRVFRVDTSSVWIDVTDHDRLTRIPVGSLIALQGANSSEYLIGILERVTRDLFEEALPDEADEESGLVPVEPRERDLCRVALLGTYRKIDGTARNTFKRGADSFPLIEAACWPVEGSRLQGLMGLLAANVPPEERLTLGAFVADKTAAAVADGNRFFQRHAGLLGSTGSGKSWAVALLLERASALPHPNLITFDLHGEYSPLAAHPSAIATRFKIAGPGDVDAPGDDVLFLPWWLLTQEEMLALFLDRSEESAPNQASRLLTHVRDLKRKRLEEEGRDDVLRHFTVDSPVPYGFDDLIAALDADDKQMVEGKNTQKQGPYFGKMTRFVARLRSKQEDRRYAFLFQPPPEASNFDWLDNLVVKMMGTSPGLKVIDFSEVPSDVLPVVVAMLARVLYQIQVWADDSSRTPLTFVCDEAHLYMPDRAPDVVQQRALDVFEKISKEGRKYGVSLVIVSQRPSDASRTVLSQCNNFLVLRLTNDVDQQIVRRLIPDSLSSLTGSLPLLDVGEALLIGDAMMLPTRIKLDCPKIEPGSSTRDFWTDWRTRPADPDALRRAVESARRQTRVI